MTTRERLWRVDGNVCAVHVIILKFAVQAPGVIPTNCISLLVAVHLEVSSLV